MPQIKRTGVITFGDASLTITEEGISVARAAGGYAGAQAWERQFKREVFARLIQQLHRLGWSTEIPEKDIKDYGKSFASNRRYCRKGDLQADLSITGRCIEFKMFQNVNAPSRPDHGGRYEHNKTAVMPYLLRLEMERTRRRIRNYLCNVMESYTFSEAHWNKHHKKIGPGGYTANEWIDMDNRSCWHYKPELDRREISMPGNAKAKDGSLIEDGQRVWTTDYSKGRIVTGIARYNINNMWWVVTGRYERLNKARFEIFTTCPENPRKKLNERLRRKRLEAELAKAIKVVNFRRAEVLRDLLWPKDEPVYMLWQKESQLYHCSNFSGYTKNPIDAGKFTLAELASWVKDGAMEDSEHKIVPLGEAA